MSTAGPLPVATRLIILAPTTLGRAAWTALLASQPYIVVSRAVHDANEVPACLEPGKPTTILVDLPSVQIELAATLHIAAPECGLLFLVQSYELSEVVALLQAGVNGCLSRDESVGDLTRAIIAVGRGEIVLPPIVAARALTSLANTARALAALSQHQPVGPTMTEALSEREAEILHLLGQGLTNKDIAQTLVVSVRTVEAHLRSIYDKLDVRSRTEAALWAARHGQTK